MKLIICNTRERAIQATLDGAFLTTQIRNQAEETLLQVSLAEIEDVLGGKLSDLSEIEQKAALFAVSAHNAAGQKRKYTNLPYWHHPFEVADIIRRQAVHDANMLAAAYLHDVTEDCETPIDLIAEQFGDDVSDLVKYLTTPKQPGSRSERARRERTRLVSATSRAKTIKIADIQSNIRDIVVLDAQFARIYIPEKVSTMDVLLTKENGEMIWGITNGMLEDRWKQLDALQKQA